MIDQYISSFTTTFPAFNTLDAWHIVARIQNHIEESLKNLSSNYTIKNNIAIHRLARIEEHVIIKSPAIISENCFIGSHAYLRGGVILLPDVSIGPGCEIKTSILFPKTALAHFNFVGDAILGSNVNMEAGSIIANHYNERENKMIHVLDHGKIIETGVIKFGALVGDGSKIGANAVLSPGTLLPQKSIVKRLELVEQVGYIA